jgi:hypothetical protein
MEYNIPRKTEGFWGKQWLQEGFSVEPFEGRRGRFFDGRRGINPSVADGKKSPTGRYRYPFDGCHRTVATGTACSPNTIHGPRRAELYIVTDTARCAKCSLARLHWSTRDHALNAISPHSNDVFNKWNTALKIRYGVSHARPDYSISTVT